MKKTRGVTLIEIIVAIVVFAVGALALAGSSAIMQRRLSDSSRASGAASISRSRAETSFSESCGAVSAGNERAPGLRSEWSVTPGVASAGLRQRVTYATRSGDHTDEFLTTVPCG